MQYVTEKHGGVYKIMKIPKHEKLMVTYIFDDIKSYIITKNILGKYILYKIIEDNLQKLKTADSPIEFDNIVKKDRSKQNGN